MIINPQNEQIKNLARLHRRKERLEAGLFLIEGVRFVEEALRTAARINKILISDKLQETARGCELLTRCQEANLEIIQVDQRILAKVAETENPQGIVAVVHLSQADWRQAFLDSGNPGTGAGVTRPDWWLVIDQVQDPGNVGTIIRTAHAAGVRGVFLTPGTVDVYNGKTLRATMGSVFHIPVFQGVPASELLEAAASSGRQTVVGDLKADRDYYAVDYGKPTLFVVGNEAQGPDPVFCQGDSLTVRIPMPGGAESLNASVACGVMLFEGVRQWSGGTSCKANFPVL